MLTPLLPGACVCVHKVAERRFEAQLASAKAEARRLRAELERTRQEAVSQHSGMQRQVEQERHHKAESMAALWSESARLHGDEAGRLREERQLADEHAQAALRRQLDLERLLDRTTAEIASMRDEVGGEASLRACPALFCPSFSDSRRLV